MALRFFFIDHGTILTLMKYIVHSRNGARHIQSKTGSKESVTVIACASAAGHIMPPHVIVKGETKQALKSWDTENAPAGALMSASVSGWTKQV